MSYYSNCKFSKLSFNLFLCSVNNEKRTAVEICPMWEQKPEDEKVNENDRTCDLCFRTEKYCRCYSYEL